MKVLYLALLGLVYSCTNAPAESNKKLVGNICEYSQWLSISEEGNQVLIEIQNPDDSSKIYRLHIPDFSSNEFSSSFDIDKPISRMACLSSTHIGMLSELGLQSHIVAVSNLKYVYDPQVKKNKPIALGEEQSVSVEKILKSKAEVIVYSAFSNSFSKEKVLNKLGILCIPNFDWRELHPLGRAEWMLLFGYLTGHQEKAKIKFNEIKAHYSDIKTKINGANPIKILSGNMTGEYWYAPAGNSYHAKLLKDAGLNYVFSEDPGTGSLAYSFEKILGMSTEIDLWLNPGFETKKEILQAFPKSNLLPFINQSSLFCYSHNANKYWERSACRPDLILADYAEMKNGPNVDGSKLVFYKKVQ